VIRTPDTLVDIEQLTVFLFGLVIATLGPEGNALGFH
jgi:hypothetical protein